MAPQGVPKSRISTSRVNDVVVVPQLTLVPNNHIESGSASVTLSTLIEVFGTRYVANDESDVVPAERLMQGWF